MNDPTLVAAASSVRQGLISFVGRRVKQPADAEDIVQIVFLRLQQHPPALARESSLYAWLYRTARNAIVDYYRSPARRREVMGAEAVEAAVNHHYSPAASEPAALQELAVCLAPLMATLDAPDREALETVDVAGETHASAAARFGLSVSGMKSRTQRARQRLRDAVEACCRVELDSRNAVTSFAPRSPSGAPACGCAESEGPVHSLERCQAPTRTSL